MITALASRGIVASKAGRGLTAVFAALGKEMQLNPGGLIGALRDMEAAGSPVDVILKDLGKQAGRAAVPLAGLTDEILAMLMHSENLAAQQRTLQKRFLLVLKVLLCVWLLPLMVL